MWLRKLDPGECSLYNSLQDACGVVSSHVRSKSVLVSITTSKRLLERLAG